MQGTTAGLRTGTSTRLAALERQRPEWQAWLRLLSEVRGALEDVRDGPVVLTGPSDSDAGPSPLPLLHGRGLEIDAAWAQRLVRRLASTAAAGELTGAASLRGYRPTTTDSVHLLGAAVRQEPKRIEALAHRSGVDSNALASVVHLAAIPVLQVCGRLFESRLPRSWPNGYCPICAAWPTLAERRGLDRSRRLRCARCGGEWEVQWLWCVYCGERVHERLGSLVPDEPGEMLKVETCASCRGYLKSVATLQAIPAFDLLLQDLETVELDLVARERGYSRPEARGFELEVRVTSRES